MAGNEIKASKSKDKWTKLENDYWTGWPYGGDPDFSCAPQATGGIPLAKIPEALQRIGTTRLDFLKDNAKLGGEAIPDSQRTLSGMAPTHGVVLADSGTAAAGMIKKIKDARTRAGKTNPDHGYKKLEGLAGLIISYLLTGAQQAVVWPYSKIIAPLMSRVNFSALHDNLEKDEVPYFTVARILKAAGNMTGTEPVFAKGYGTEAQGSDPGDVERGPTREAWITSIMTKTIDLMSFKGGSSVAGGATRRSPGNSGSSSSLGAFAEMDTTPDGVKLAVLELRRLPKNPVPALWKDLALAIFTFFQTLDTSLRDAPEPVAAEGAEATPVEAVAEVAVASAPVLDSPPSAAPVDNPPAMAAVGPPPPEPEKPAAAT